MVSSTQYWTFPDPLGGVSSADDTRVIVPTPGTPVVVEVPAVAVMYPGASSPVELVVKVTL